MSDNGLFNKIYNPDVLNCLANLSNDEVFTPPEVANQMLDLLPQELFKNPDTKFLDPACKSGVFLREIAKRLLVGLELQIPDLQDRIDHIFQNQLYGIAITELTSLLSRRSVYCSKYPNSDYSVSLFDDPEGNIRFRKIQHTWDKGKCTYCGASRSQYNRDFNLETHAYEFIHLSNAKELLNMKFDVIIGNPPYQLSDGGNAASASPLYHLFVQQALRLRPHYLLMIIPARWYAGGKGLDDFRTLMLEDSHLTELIDIPNSSDCFPGVNIAGGICYFLWEKDYAGHCNVINMKEGKIVSEYKRPLNEYSFFVRNNFAIDVIRKVVSKANDTMNNIVYSRNYFKLPTTVTGSSEKQADSIEVLTSKGLIYLANKDIKDSEGLINKYKVIITYAMSGGNKPSSEGNYQVLSSLKILGPRQVCSETYLILDAFDNKNEASNLLVYASSKFFRFLLLQALSSIHITKDKFCFIPVLDFTKAWTDEELYAKYNLSDEEIEFIESMIKPMDIEEE